MRTILLTGIVLLFGCSKKDSKIPERAWPQPQVNIVFPFINSNEQIIGNVGILQKGYDDIHLEVYTNNKKGYYGKENIPEFLKQRANFIIDNPGTSNDSLYVKMIDDKGRSTVFSYYIKPLQSNTVKGVWEAMSTKYIFQSNIYNLKTVESFTALEQTGGLSQTIIKGLPGTYRFDYSGDVLSKIIINGDKWIKDSDYYPYAASVEDFQAHVIDNLGDPVETRRDYIRIINDDLVVECQSKSCTVTQNNK